MSTPAAGGDFTVKEFARQTHQSEQSVYRKIRVGLIPSYKVGGAVRIRREDVEQIRQPRQQETTVTDAADLDWASVRPHPIGSRDVASAAGLFVDGVSDGTLRHTGQLELTKAVLGAKQRPIGQSFGWDRKAPGSSVLIAASLALFGVSVPRPVRPRRGERRERRATLLM